MTNTEYALRALQVWYRESGLSFKGITFDEAVDYLTNRSEPRRLYLDIFGGSVKTVGLYKAEDAMFSLAEANQGKIPDPAYFHDMLYDKVNPWKLQNFVPIVVQSVGAGLSDTVKVGVDYGGFGLKSVYWMALAGVGIYIVILATSTGKAHSGRIA